MSTNSNFRARLGDETNPGFLSRPERPARIETGISPFVTGTELPGNSPVFFGREQVMHEILSALRRPEKPGCVSLLGERRMGKSSLLNQLFAALGKEEGLVTILGSAQAWYEYTPAAFFSDLHRSIEGAIAGVSSTGEPAGPSSPAPVTDYPGFRDFIRRHAGRYRFVLILDEFETMAGDSRFDTSFFANLRHLGSTPQFRFGYLLASRKPLSELREQDRGFDSSSFWNIFGIAHVVGLLQPKDTRALIREPWQRSLQHTPLWPEAMERLEELVGAHPALLQMVLDRMWSACAGGYELAPDETRRGLWEYFDGIWRHRSEEEKELLLKIVDTGPVPDNRLLWDLRSRGLITEDGRLFSKFFEYFVASEYPEISALGDYGNIGAANGGLDRLHSGLRTGLGILGDIVKRIIVANVA